MPVRADSASVENPPAGAAPDARLPHGYLGFQDVYGATGPATFEFDNSTGQYDAEVRMYRADSVVRSLFVHHGMRFEVDELRFGAYTVKYKIVVNGKPHAYQANQIFQLKQTAEESRQGRYNKFNRTRVTMFNLAGDKLASSEIPLDQF